MNNCSPNIKVFPEFFEAAKRYYEDGFNVVAVRLSIAEDGSVEKRPLVNWSAWMNRRQTEEEFEKQEWADADGFAIICNQPNKEGLYLAVVDYDIKKVSGGAKRQGEKMLERFPPTRIERTVSGGLHYVYLSKVKPNPVSEAHDSCALELIAGPKLCVMAPSKGYRALNDNPPRVVEDAEGLFREILKLPNPRMGKINDCESKEKLERWLEQIKSSLNVAGEGPNYLYAHCPFHEPDRHPSFAVHKFKFYGVDYHTGEIFSLKELAKRLNIKLEGDLEGEEEKKIDLRLLAEEILKEAPIKTERRTKLMYRWNGRFWCDDAESYIQEKLVRAEGEAYKPYHLTALVEIIQGLTFVDGFEEPPANLINFQNGVLDINTLELKPHSPEHFFRNMIHAEFRPEAKAEKFLSWLKEILPDEDARRLVQEISGYCFYRGYPIHKVFFLVGSGRNGKGTLMRTLQDLLGRENCASIPLERLGERFQSTNLIGKLINVVSEPRTTYLTTEFIKMLTGEDLISAEIKGKQKNINFVNYAKLIVLANRLPPVHDSTLAWWSRVVVVEFPVEISPEKQIPNIEQNWLEDEEERSGIVNWMLEGLKRLLVNKRFTETSSLKEAVEEYKKWSAPAEYFLMNYCIVDGKSLIPKKNLFELFKEVCAAEGLNELSERAFNEAIKRIPRVREEVRKIQGKAVRCWLGIKLNAEKVKELEGINGFPVTEVTGVTGFPYSGKSSEGEEREEKLSEEKFFNELEKPVTSVTSVTGQPFSQGLKRIDIYRCGDCRFYERVKCLLRREWVAVLPTHPACELFEPREAAGS